MSIYTHNSNSVDVLRFFEFQAWGTYGGLIVCPGIAAVMAYDVAVFWLRSNNEGTVCAGHAFIFVKRCFAPDAVAFV